MPARRDGKKHCRQKEEEDKDKEEDNNTEPQLYPLCMVTTLQVLLLSGAELPPGALPSLTLPPPLPPAPLPPVCLH